MPRPPRRPLEAVIRDKDGQQIARCLIQRGRYVIGQDWKNEIIVNDPTVSLKHARLTMETETAFFIEDLESANGTRINGEPVSGAQPITFESWVELGGTTLELQRGGLPAAIFETLPDGFLRKNRYNIGEIAVEGSTSTIFSAYDTSLCRDVAIKVLRPESQSRMAHVLRFVREAQLSSQLQHPGVLPVYELDLDSENQLFYTTRFVEGDSLADILDAVAATEPGGTPPQTLHSLLLILGKVCDVIGFAHSRGVTHCCLRPECITVGTFGEVFVNQWGVARVDQCDAKGKPIADPLRVDPSHALPPLSPFSSPEQACEAFDEINAATDIYALGGLLYRILSLRNPVVPSADASLLELVLGNVIPPLASFHKVHFLHCPDGSIPEALAALATRALSYKTEERPASVSRFRREITDFERGISPAEPGLWKHFSGLLGKH